MPLIPLREILQGAAAQPITISANSVYVPSGFRPADSTVIVGSGKQYQVYTPSTESQIISQGNYLIGDQVIKGDPNLIASNIVYGTSIFGVQGTRVVSGGGVDTNDATAYASDLLQDKTAYVRGSKISGTIPKVQPYTSQNTIYIPQGYIQTATSIVLSDSLSIAYRLQQTTYQPGTQDIILSAGTYLQGDQTILGDSNLAGSNILSGVSIFGVQGALIVTSGVEVVLGYLTTSGTFQSIGFSGTSAYDSGDPADLSCYTWNIPENINVVTGEIISTNFEVVQPYVYKEAHLQPGAKVSVYNGGVISNPYVNSGASLSIASGGSAVDFYMGVQGYSSNAGKLYISSGAYVGDLRVFNYGAVMITSGASVDKLYIAIHDIESPYFDQHTIRLDIFDSANIGTLIVESSKQLRAGDQYAAFGSGVTISSLYVEPYGQASFYRISDLVISTVTVIGGIVNFVATTATLGKVGVSRWGTLYVGSSASAGSVYLYTDVGHPASCVVYGTADKVTVSSACILTMQSVGSADSVLLMPGGSLIRYSGAQINSLTSLSGAVIIQR